MTVLFPQVRLVGLQSDLAIVKETELGVVVVQLLRHHADRYSDKWKHNVYLFL